MKDRFLKVVTNIVMVCSLFFLGTAQTIATPCTNLFRNVPFTGINTVNTTSQNCYGSESDPGLRGEVESLAERELLIFCPTNLCDNGDCPDNEQCSLSAGPIQNTPLTVTLTPSTACNNNQYHYNINVVFPQNGIAHCYCGCCPPADKGKSLENTSEPKTCKRGCKCHSNLVELSNFIAKPTDKGISLNWNTETELDSQGFRIWRAIPDLSRYCGCSGNIDDYTQIQVLDEEGKPVLIPAKGSTTSGFDYAYLDEKAKPGIAYCYALEDVDSKGESKFYFEYVAFTPDGLSEETK